MALLVFLATPARTRIISTDLRSFLNLEVLPIPTHQPMVRIDRPDTIYKNEPAKFQAVVNKLKELHAKGQPALVGTIAIEKSELLSEMLKRQGVPHHVLNAKFHEQEAEIVSKAGQKGAVTIATNMAGRGTDIKLGEGVVELGGLAILGTERHESRRIDNQLRGRAGRQGDKGESQFYISLEDNLMRIFGGDRIKGMMEFLKMPEDMPIENKMISGAIESAQRRVEGHHFDMRKHVVEYDDVMNKHREIIYSRRRKILHKKSVRQDILEMIQDFVARVVNLYILNRSPDEFDLTNLVKEVQALYDDGKITKEILEPMQTPEEIQEYLNAYLLKAYEEREKLLPDPSLMRNIERGVYLRSIDILWMEHLDNMQSLREAVSLQGYAQKDPLVEYKREGYLSFEKLLGSINHGTLQTMFHLEFKPQEAEKLTLQDKPQQKIMTNEEQIESNITDSDAAGDKPTTVKVKGQVQKGPEVGRNDPCPCGSGKKYKKCHGQES